MSTALAAATAMAAASSSAAPAATSLTTTNTTNNTTNSSIVTATASPATNTTITNTAKTTINQSAGTLEQATESEDYLQEEQVPPELVDHSLQAQGGHQLIYQTAPKPRRQRRATVVHTCPRPPGGYRYSMEFLYGIGSCMAGTTLNIATPLSITPRNVRTTPPSLTTRMPLLTTMGMPASASPRPIDGSLHRNRYAIGMVAPGSPGGLTAVTAAVPTSSQTTTTATPGSSPGSSSPGGVITNGSSGNLPTAQFIYQGYLPSGPQRRLWHAENAFWQFDRNYPYNQGYASQYGIPMMPVGFEHPYGSQRIIYPGYYSHATGPFHAAPVSGMPRVSRHVTTSTPQQQQQQQQKHSAAQQQPQPVPQQQQQQQQQPAAPAVVSVETSEEPKPPSGNGQNMGSVTWRHQAPGAHPERRQSSAPSSATYHRESKSYYNSATGATGGGPRFKGPFDQQQAGGGSARNYPVGAAPLGAVAGAAPAAGGVGSRDQNSPSANQSRNYQGSGSNNSYSKGRHHGKRGGKHLHGKEPTSNSSGSLSASSSKSHLERGASSTTSLAAQHKHPNRSYRNRFRYINSNEASSDRKSVSMGVAVPVATYHQQPPQPAGMRRLPKFQGAAAYQGHVLEGGKPVVSRQQSRYYQSRNMDAYVYQPGHYMLYAAGAAPMGLGGGVVHPGLGGMAMGPGAGGGGGGAGIAESGNGGGGGGAATARASSATSEGEQPLDSDFDQRQDYADLGLDPANGGFSSDLEPLGYKQDTSEMDAHSCLLSHPCSDIEIADAQSIASAAQSTTASQDSDTTESDLSGASVESVVRKVMVSCLAIATGAEVPDLNGPNLVPYGDMHHLMELEFQSQPAMTNGYRSVMHHHHQSIHHRMRGMSCCGDMLSQPPEEMAYKLEQEQQQEDAIDGGGKSRYEVADFVTVESACSTKSAEACLSARSNINLSKESPEDGVPQDQDMHNCYWREFFGYTPADRFLLRARLVEMKRPPRTVPSSTKWEPLSLCIWRKFLEAQQTRHIYKTKMRLWRYIYTVAMSAYPRYGLYLVGSSISHFGSKFSDMDICMLACTNPNLDPRMEAVYHLQLMKELLSRTNEFQDFNLIEARVPILRFTDSRHKVEVDINFNNSVGIRNTHLLYCYSQLDWRVRPMALTVKQWAQYHNINNAKNMTISSYSLMLMVIHFLQAGANPPVLPCLHKVYPDKFGLLLPSDFGYVDMNEVMGPYPSDNTQSLGELLLGFLHYFSVFEYGKYAISIRVGGVLPVEVCRASKASKNDIHQWNELCIEEPFDQTNTARSVYDSNTFERIRAIFQASYRRLDSTRNLSSVFEDYDGPTIVMQQPSGDSECDFYEGQQQQHQHHQHQMTNRALFRSNSEFPSPRPLKLMVDKATTAIWTDINIRTDQKEPEEEHSQKKGVDDDPEATEPPLA